MLRANDLGKQTLSSPGSRSRCSDGERFFFPFLLFFLTRDHLQYTVAISLLALIANSLDSFSYPFSGATAALAFKVFAREKGIRVSGKCEQIIIGKFIAYNINISIYRLIIIGISYFLFFYALLLIQSQLFL